MLPIVTAVVFETTRLGVKIMEVLKETKPVCPLILSSTDWLEYHFLLTPQVEIPYSTSTSIRIYDSTSQSSRCKTQVQISKSSRTSKCLARP